MNKNQNENAWGFTLIEVILVLALVTSLGALAAPQFTDVFDHSKDQADIAQMDQILAAFQLEQAPFFEEHNGKYDLLQEGNVKYIEKNGEIVDTIVIPDEAEKTLQTFLNNVVKPGSDIYMEGVKCVKTEKTHVVKNGKQRSVFEAKLNSAKTALKIVCRADKNESSIELPLPGLNIPIDDKYSDGKIVNGTWMIIGDDDLLRADYVEDYLKKKDQDIKKKLDDELEKNKPYKYRATFKIETILKKDTIYKELGSNIKFKEEWLIWAPEDANGTAHDAIKKGALAVLDGIDIDCMYDGAGNGNNDYLGSLGVEGVEILLPQGNGENSIVFKFKKKGEKTLMRVYTVEAININNSHSSGSSYIMNGNPNDANEGYIKTQEKGGNPHYFHYKYSPSMSGYIDEDISGATGIEEEIEYPRMDFYTGFILNAEKEDKKEVVEYKKYDFLAFHYNKVTGKTELSYKEFNGNSIRTIGEGIELDHFQYNHSYTMEVDVRKDKAVYITLYDKTTTLLESKKLKMGNNTLLPAIGFYMNERAELESPSDAVTDDAGEIPLICYEDSNEDGPRFVLLGLPEFYPYTQNLDSGSGNAGGGDENSGTGPDEPDKPAPFLCEKPEIGKYSENPSIPYKASVKTQENSVQYKWVEGIENTEKPAANQGWGDTYSVADGKSGWLWVREYKGDSFAPEEKWEKKPWVGSEQFNNTKLIGSGTASKYEVSFHDSFPKMEIVYKGGSNQGWSTKPPKLSLGNETVYAYVRYNDKQVSCEITKNSYNIPEPFSVDVDINYRNINFSEVIFVPTDLCIIEYRTNVISWKTARQKVKFTLPKNSSWLEVKVTHNDDEKSLTINNLNTSTYTIK